MRVLIVYASRYGVTQEIAEHIGCTLLKLRLETTVQPAQRADDPAGYDVAVIGSDTYYSRWMKPATKCVRRYRDALANRPVWFFSSGSLGSEANNAQDRSTRAVAQPKEIAEFRQTIKLRDHHVFIGALDPNKLGFTDRLRLKLAANRDKALFPLGDFRDWNDVEAWATNIAHALKWSSNPVA